MPSLTDEPALIGGRLAIDFANAPAHPGTPQRQLLWDEFVTFLQATAVVSPERAAALLALPRSDRQAADTLHVRALRLHEALRAVFGAMVQGEGLSRDWVAPINDILRVTEGHDELAFDGANWKLEFVARESGLDWLLAAIARSAAEIISEGTNTHLRFCASPSCTLFFYDDSRTGRRRWCSMAVCGNRHKVATFARRNAS